MTITAVSVTQTSKMGNASEPGPILRVALLRQRNISREIITHIFAQHASKARCGFPQHAFELRNTFSPHAKNNVAELFCAVCRRMFLGTCFGHRRRTKIVMTGLAMFETISYFLHCSKVRFFFC